MPPVMGPGSCVCGKLSWRLYSGLYAGKQGWSSAEDLSLPASDDARPVDYSSIGFLRAFIDDLRTDRERVESSASFVNNHGSAIELDYSSDAPTSAHRRKSSTASKLSRHSEYVEGFTSSDDPDLVVTDRVD